MANQKKHQKSQSKEKISTSKIFKKVKNIKYSQPSKSQKTPQYPLAAAFSEAVEQSKTQIQKSVNVELEAATKTLSNSIDEFRKSLDVQKQKTFHQIESATKPLDEQVLVYDLNDKKSSGTTTLGLRVQKLKQVIRTEEDFISRQVQAMRSLETEFQSLADEILGAGVYASLPTEEEGGHEASQILQHQAEKLQEEITAITGKAAKLLEDAIEKSVQEMQDSEKKLNLKQSKTQESFYAILRDEA